MSQPSPRTKPRAVSNVLEARLRKLYDLQALGVDPFRTGFVPHLTAALFKEKYEFVTGSDEPTEVIHMAGRIVALNIMGKASFIRLRDSSGDFQAYLSKDSVGNDKYKLLKKLDIGDIIGVTGRPFRTRTDELSVMSEDFILLTKSLRPLPEKWHGLQDVETRYRQRYLDLIVNPEVREIVKVRGRIISLIRTFLTDQGFLEVETPMMQPIPGGATAKPFVTYHHALDRSLYLRIAPELYLKRLLIGGFDKVFEINRNFRNEGVSSQHNPEFTMIEFYQAFATYEDLMDLTQEMLSALAIELFGGFTLTYAEREVDLTPPWDRMSVKQALMKYCGLKAEQVESRDFMLAETRRLGLEAADDEPLGKLWMKVFDEKVEEHLWGPIFIHSYPVEVSPLARRNDQNPHVVDRFELYITGREMANAFTELTDPIDQRSRFEEQVQARASGDEEAHFLDEDFLTALEYGMPPAAGEGLGIDRLVMLMTDAASIREVILFPHLRPEKEVE